MVTQKSKLLTEQILPPSILKPNKTALDLYKETAGILKETNDILEETKDILKQTAIALGRNEKKYIYRSSSTKNIKINCDRISLITESYKFDPATQKFIPSYI